MWQKRINRHAVLQNLMNREQKSTTSGAAVGVGDFTVAANTGIIAAEIAVKMSFIHEKPGWPDLRWNDQILVGALAAVRNKQGRLLGQMEGLGFDLRAEASLAVLTSEVVKSSAIEGEVLNPAEVRSSIARRLGLDVAGLPTAGRDVEGGVPKFPG